MVLTKKSYSRMLLVCLWLLMLVCSPVSAKADFMDEVRGFVKGVVSTANGVKNTVTYKAEGVLDSDLNNDGQIGKFHNQDGKDDVRQVGQDKNAGKRFQISRDNSDGRRALVGEEQTEEKAAPTPRLRK